MNPSCVIRCIHGIHSPEGDNNMAHFAPHLQRAMPEAIVKLNEYGFMGFWQARFENRQVARDLAAAHHVEHHPRVPEIWVTHSNGAAVAYLAATEFGAKPDMIVNFNPALDRWRTAPVPCVETIHAKDDRWVTLAQWLPFHIWGDQGCVGYRGRMNNTINHAATTFGDGMAYEGHTGAFEPSRRVKWALFTVSRIEAYLERRATQPVTGRRATDFPLTGESA